MKEYLSQKGIEFTNRDITIDKSAITELEGLGVMTTPVLVVDDEVVVGFDRQKLDSLLAT